MVSTRPTMTTNSTITVQHTTWEDEDGVHLRARLISELIAGGVEDELGPPLTAAEIPIFIIIYRNSVPIACGGLRLVPDEEHACEIKRMYVVPEHRGRGNGVSDRLMTELESAATGEGWKVVRLATGTDMLQARRFYERHGYEVVPVFGHYVVSGFTVFYEKTVGQS